MTTMAQHQSVGSAAPDDDDEWFAGVREQYDGVADAYDLADRTPVKLVVMGPSVLGALRSELRRSTLAGTTGVDLACGTGFLTRLLAADGARVIGIDISPQMIERARANRHERIEYRVGDVYQLDAAQLRASTAEGFDFVVAGFLFNYATRPEQIETLTRQALALLRPGGVVVALLPNPDLPIIAEDTPATLRYGLSAAMDLPVRDGAPRRVTYWRPDGTRIVTVEHTHWSRDVYTREMTRGGATVEWHHCQPAVADPAADEFWRDYVAAPQHDIAVLRPVAAVSSQAA